MQPLLWRGCKTSRHSNSEAAPPCYACLVAGANCTNRNPGSKCGGTRCDRCRKLGFSHWQCAVPILGIFHRKWRSRRPWRDQGAAVKLGFGNTSGSTCHICATPGPSPHWVGCAGCRLVICEQASCRAAARFLDDLPFYFCAHCLQVPFACGCVPAHEEVAKLALTVPLPEQPPAELRNPLLVIDEVDPVVASDDRSWLLHAARPRKWHTQEHDLLRCSLLRFRRCVEQCPSLDVMNLLTGMLRRLPWPATTTLFYLQQLERQAPLEEYRQVLAAFRKRGGKGAQLPHRVAMGLDGDRAQLLAAMGWPVASKKFKCKDLAVGDYGRPVSWQSSVRARKRASAARTAPSRRARAASATSARVSDDADAARSDAAASGGEVASAAGAAAGSGVYDARTERRRQRALQQGRRISIDLD